MSQQAAVYDALVAKALSESLPQEMRDRLFLEAVQNVIKKPEGYSMHGPKESSLENAFRHAVEHSVMKLVGELIAQPEYQAKLRAVVVEAFDRVMVGENRPLLVDVVAGSFRKFFESR